MNELYSIMRDFLEIEYNQKSLLHILKILEKAYSSTQQNETALAANAAKNYLKGLQKELKMAISRMDHYLAESAEKRKETIDK